MDISRKAGVDALRGKHLHVFQSVFLGALAAALHAFDYNRFYNISVALLLYVAAILLPRQLALLSIAIFAVGSLPVGVSIEASRIVIFSLLLCWFSGDRRKVAPLVVVGAGWILFLLVMFAAKTEVQPSSLSFYLLNSIAELLGAAFLGLAAGSHRISASFGRRYRPTPLGLTVLHLFFLVAVLSALAAGYVVAAASGIEMQQLLLNLSSNRAAGMASIVFIVGVVFSCSQILGRMLGQVSESLQALANPNKRMLQAARSHLPFAEFDSAIDKIRSALDSALSSLRIAQMTNKEFQIKADQQEREISSRELAAANLTHLMQAAPWSFLAVSGSGAIIEANATFFATLGLEYQELVGTHYSEIAGEHPWLDEIKGLLDWVTRDAHLLLGRGRIKHYTLAVENKFLEMQVEVTQASKAAIIPRKSGAQRHPPSDLAVVLYGITRPDTRQFELQLLNPNQLEISGSQAIDILKELQKNFASLIGHLSIASAKLTNSENPYLHSLFSRPEGMEFLLLLKDVDKIARQSSAEIDEFFQKANLSLADKKNCNLSLQLQLVLDYLYDLLNLDERLIVSTSGRARLPSSLDGSGDLVAQLENVKPDIIVQVNQDELNLFLVLVCSLVRNIMAKTTELQVELGYEEIGSGTANIIPGSAPGNYARLVFSHPGQSITANMLSARPAAALKASNGPETVLGLLALQTRHLGGFLSVQSSQSKGTNITFYLPVLADAAHTSRIPRAARRQLAKRADAAPKTGNALLVASEEPVIEQTTGLLRSLGYEVRLESPAEVLNRLTRPIGTTGSGFDSGNASFEEEDAYEEKDTYIVRTKADAAAPPSAYDLVLVNIEGLSDDIVAMLHALEAEQIDALIILILDSSPQSKEVFEDWPSITKPVEIEDLTEAIRSAGHSASASPLPLGRVDI